MRSSYRISGRGSRPPGVFVVSSLAEIVLKLPRVSAPANASATTETLEHIPIILHCIRQLRSSEWTCRWERRADGGDHSGPDKPLGLHEAGNPIIQAFCEID
jgi:hypothetical protein